MMKRGPGSTDAEIAHRLVPGAQSIVPTTPPHLDDPSRDVLETSGDMTPEET
jgi:hypothetical protein